MNKQSLYISLKDLEFLLQTIQSDQVVMDVLSSHNQDKDSVVIGVVRTSDGLVYKILH
jgi:hypothetical protein